MSEQQGEYTTKRKYHDALDDALDRPIAYNPAFKKITNSTVAGIFLSQAWYWSKRHKNDDGWFYKTGKEWEDETGLTRSEQETARKHCLRVGVIEEKLKGIPATMYYRVVKSRVYTLLGLQFVEIPQTGQIAGNQQSDDHSNINKESETPPTIPPESSEGGGRNPLFDLYENSIGMLNTQMADDIEAAEKTYSFEWTFDAIVLAGKNGAKHFNYCKSVLERWKREGRETKPGKKQSAAQSEDPSKYLTGEYSDCLA